MQNRRHSCSWRSKHQSEGTRKHHKIPELEITGAEVVGCQSYSNTFVVGALGTVSEELENHLKAIGIPIVISCLQKAALLVRAFILRRVLDILESGQLSDVKAFFSFSCHVVVMLYQK